MTKLTAHGVTLKAVSISNIAAFGKALVQIYNWQFADAVTSLAATERGCRSNRSHAFILWNRGIAAIRQTAPIGTAERPAHPEPGQLRTIAISYLNGAKAQYRAFPPSLRRLFWTKRSTKLLIPGELAYEPRQLGSEEMATLLDAWLVLSGDATDEEAVISKLDRLHEDDLLLRWCRHALRARHVTSPDDSPWSDDESRISSRSRKRGARECSETSHHGTP